MANEQQMERKENILKACSVCETMEDVFPTRHIPLSGVRIGHVTLTSMTYFCKSCLKAESEKVTKGMNKLFDHFEKEQLS